jgi:hypothetical protein
MVEAATVVAGCACPVDAGRRTPNRDSDSVTDRFGGWRSGAAGRVQPGAGVADPAICQRR